MHSCSVADVIAIAKIYLKDPYAFILCITANPIAWKISTDIPKRLPIGYLATNDSYHMMLCRALEGATCHNHRLVSVDY